MSALTLKRVPRLLQALINRPKRSAQIRTLLEHDRRVRAKRLSRARLARPLQGKSPAAPVAPTKPAPASPVPVITTPLPITPQPQPAAAPRTILTAAARQQTRPQKYMNGFIDFHQSRPADAFADLRRFDTTEDTNA